jgi:hypothetical protein
MYFNGGFSFSAVIVDQFKGTRWAGNIARMEK